MSIVKILKKLPKKAGGGGFTLLDGKEWNGRE